MYPFFVRSKYLPELIMVARLTVIEAILQNTEESPGTIVGTLIRRRAARRSKTEQAGVLY